MKSSNYYKGIVLILSLLLSLLMIFTSCDGASEGGDTSSDGSAAGTNGETDPEVSGGETTDGSEGNGVASSDPSGTEGAPNVSEDTSLDSGSSDPDDSGESGESESSSGSQGGSDPVESGSGSTGGIGTITPGVTPDVTVEYTVKVVDAAGNPVNTTVIVKLFAGTVQKAMKPTNSSGIATFVVAKDSYTFTLESMDTTTEYTYDTTVCAFTGDVTSVTVTFLPKLAVDEGGGDTDEDPNGRTIWADPDVDGELAEYYAPFVEEGNFSVELAANDMTYVLFKPTRAGQYRVRATSTTATLDIGYYGGIHYVLTAKGAEMIGDFFELNVRESAVGTSADSTQLWVIGVKTVDGSAANAVLTIERFGDAATDSADAPWNVIEADPTYLKEYDGDTTGTLTNVDITDASVQFVKGSDGYYHLGNESGPVVMIRISSKSTYIDSFTTICDVTALPCYYYDDDGTFLSKEHYNTLIASYAEYVNSDGVVPLNDQLINMMDKVGNFMGWWDEDSGQYLFKDVNEVTENAWMFACCYYA